MPRRIIIWAGFLRRKGQLDEAVAHYEKALEINPADAEAHNNLGVTLFGERTCG